MEAGGSQAETEEGCSRWREQQESVLSVWGYNTPAGRMAECEGAAGNGAV